MGWRVSSPNLVGLLLQPLVRLLFSKVPRHNGHIRGAHYLFGQSDGVGGEGEGRGGEERVRGKVYVSCLYVQYVRMRVCVVRTYVQVWGDWAEGGVGREQDDGNVPPTTTHSPSNPLYTNTT